MGSDSQCFDPAALALSAAASGSPEPVPRVASDTDPIGYEAADPSLQAPQWLEALQGLPSRRDWR